MAESTAEELIALLGLKPHPEGGHFRETFRDSAADAGGRAASTAILFLLRAGEISHWHRVDAAEVWHFYRGAPLQLSLWDERGPVQHCRLGAEVERGEAPQVVVPRKVWQKAQSLGAYTLVGCTVAPGFEFAGFELADADFEPSTGR